VDKWLAIQAASRLPGTLEQVKQLTQHEAFNLKNPNKVRALIGSFAQNKVQFHDVSGAGYEFLTEKVLQFGVILKLRYSWAPPSHGMAPPRFHLGLFTFNPYRGWGGLGGVLYSVCFR